MKRIVLYFLNAILIVLVSGCAEDSQHLVPGSDSYEGSAHELTLLKETKGFDIESINCAILAPDGNIIFRSGKHRRGGEVSTVKFDHGLADGEYRLLYFEFDRPDTPEYADLPEKFKTVQFGLGSRIKVAGGRITVTDSFDENIGLTGSGTKENPYIISSYQSLMKMMLYVNNSDTNGKITESTYFQQTNPIDLDLACFLCERDNGWIPIGCDTNTPFRGVYLGDELSWLRIDRPNSAGVGLFGYVHNATIYGVRLTHAEVTGNFAVGGIVGACISGGNSHGKSSIINCSSTKGEITGSAGSVNVGGLVGALDMYSRTLIARCATDGGSIKADYNAGGIVGGSGIYSRADILGCQNNAEVSGGYSGTGGIIGTADTLNLVSATNYGKIRGAIQYKAGDKENSSYGTGGIAGGTGMAWLSAASNNGEVTGYDGVGGVTGSSRIKGSDTESTVFNNVYFRWVRNEGEVSGHDYVGGISGECQFGSYGAYNTAAISGNDFVGGIVGNTAICVAHNSVNAGEVKGNSHVAGIVGKASWGSLAFDHNMSAVKGNGHHVAGVLGLAGNNTMVHYCGNFGAITNQGNGPTAGLIGEIGDPRKWTGAQIADCVIGAAEGLLGLAGPLLCALRPVLEVSHHTLMAVLEVTEFTAHWVVTAADIGMFSYVMYEMLNPEMVEELDHVMEEEINIHIDAMADRMEELRDPSVCAPYNSFSAEAYSTYFANVKDNLQQYEVEGNDTKFNDAMNEAREERMEEMEKHHESTEMIHQIVSGICLVLGSVAAIGSFIATGGATAVAFVAAGSAVAIAGSSNAITKACLEFEENVVLIDQCINAGSVQGPDGRIAGLVAVLQDNSIMSDCINTGMGFDGGLEFTDLAKPESMAERCLAIGTGFARHPIDDFHAQNSVRYTETSYSVNEIIRNGTAIIPMTRSQIGDITYMTKGFPNHDGYVCSPGFEIGEGKRWMMGAGTAPFPVPNKSVYLE